MYVHSTEAHLLVRLAGGVNGGADMTPPMHRRAHTHTNKYTHSTQTRKYTHTHTRELIHARTNTYTPTHLVKMAREVQMALP